MSNSGYARAAGRAPATRHVLRSCPGSRFGLGLKLSPRPYGEFAMETMDSYGGWIGAPVDYLRFILAIDGRRGTALLDAATLAQMNAPSRWQAAAADDEFRAKGTWVLAFASASSRTAG